MTAPLTVRVTVLDSWEDATFAVVGNTTIEELKRTALAHARVRRPPSEYVVKYQGAELSEGGRTIGDSGVVSNAGLIVLRRKRVPAR